MVNCICNLPVNCIRTVIGMGYRFRKGDKTQVLLEGKGIHLQVETKDPELIRELNKVKKYLKDPEK